MEGLEARVKRLDPAWRLSITETLQELGWKKNPFDELAIHAAEYLAKEMEHDVVYSRVTRLHPLAKEGSPVAVPTYSQGAEPVQIVADRLLNTAYQKNILSSDNQRVVAPVKSEAERHPHGFLELAGEAVSDQDRAKVAYVARQLKGWYDHTFSLDELTGLYCRAQFERDCGFMVKDATESGHPLALIMIDGNGVKEVNELLGYDRGNEWMAAIGIGLRNANRRDIDNFYRMSPTGDEFGLLLPGTDSDGARRFYDSVVVPNVRREIDAFLKQHGTPKPLQRYAGRPTEAGISNILETEVDSPFRLRSLAEERLHTAKAESKYSR